jgi:type IX secretion system PorP/SprF family membrane protein
MPEKIFKRQRADVPLLYRCMQLLMLTAFLCTTAEAQQAPFLAHYYNNQYLINPASAGDAQVTQASLLWRQQWAGISGAPQTQALAVNGLVREKKIGLGVMIVNDATNVVNRFSASLSTSYRIDFASSHNLSFGMSAGVLRYQLDFDMIKGDVTDAALLTNGANATRLEGTAGVVYKYQKFTLGFVSEQLLNRSFSFIDEPGSRQVTFKLVRHYLLYAGYNISVHENVTVQPLLLLRSAQGLPSHVELNAIVNYKKKAWLNVQHRPKSATAISIGASVTERFALSYAYELSASPIAKASAGSHEVMLTMKFLPDKRSPNEVSAKSEKKRRSPGTDLATLEQLDELRQKNESLNSALMEQKRMIETQNSEIQNLRQNIDDVQSEMRAMVQQNSVDLEAEKIFDVNAEYVLVVGATKKLSDARAFQKMVIRETGLTTYVKQNALQSWYFIYSDVLKSNEDARKKMKVLQKKNISSLILGNPWVYKSGKAK